MTKGKMNWHKCTKDNYGWKHGRIDCEDEDLNNCENFDVEGGVKADLNASCPFCSAEIPQLLLQEHLRKRHNFDIDDSLFCFLVDKRLLANRPFSGFLVEEMQKVLLNNPTEANLQLMMLELIERQTNLAKNFATNVISKYLELKRLPYRVSYDNKLFVVYSTKPHCLAYSAGSFAEILRWFKNEYSGGSADIKAIAQSPGVNKQVEKFIPAGVNRPKLLSDYQGAASYDGMSLLITQNPGGTFHIALKTPNMKYQLCSSTRLDTAIAVADYFSKLSEKPRISEIDRHKKVMSYYSRVVITGQRIIVERDSKGCYDIDLRDMEMTQSICRGANSLAASAIMEYLTSKAFEQHVKSGK